MPMVAQQAPYTLFVVDDTDPINPRENRDNLRFEVDERDKEPYHIKTYCDIFKKWYLEATYEVPPLEAEDEIVDTALQFLEDS
ncbi:MAG: hypothetical protein FWE82_10180, partial [Defluviitaleaceae bacterium]|nr:hypothetical protein [Defluviitaleaceae bacterium]